MDTINSGCKGLINMKKYNHAEGDYDSSCGCSCAEGFQSTAFSKNDYILYNGICNHHYLKELYRYIVFIVRMINVILMVTVNIRIDWRMKNDKYKRK